MEATTVINILEDLGTPVQPISNDTKAFLSKLKSLNGKEFDEKYRAAELSNHEFLHDLAQDYIDGVDEKILGNEKKHFMLQTWHCLRLQNMSVYVKGFPVK